MACDDEHRNMFEISGNNKKYENKLDKSVHSLIQFVQKSRKLRIIISIFFFFWGTRHHG